MVFINEIEPGKLSHSFSFVIVIYFSIFVVEFSYSLWEEANDSGYSDVSGDCSPSPRSPRSPPLSPVSDGFQFVYVPVVPYYIYPIYPSDIPLAISPVPDQYIKEENVEFTIQTPVVNAPSPYVGRLIKWTLPPPTVPFYPLPDWDPMP